MTIEINLGILLVCILSGIITGISVYHIISAMISERKIKKLMNKVYSDAAQIESMLR